MEGNNESRAPAVESVAQGALGGIATAGETGYVSPGDSVTDVPESQILGGEGVNGEQAYPHKSYG